MITIQAKRPIKLPVDKSILEAAAQLSLEMTHSSSQADVGIVIGNDALLRKLNRQYRGVDRSTDVLSFPAGEIDPDTSDVYLGDVIISLPQAEQQAAIDNHSVAAELQLLVVHGVLHLLGHDHVEIAGKVQMQAVQDKILHALNLDMKLTL